jgi:hypothetical protein
LNYNDKFTLKTDRNKNAIYNHPMTGPQFGGGFDICINDDSNIKSYSYANIGHTYHNDQYVYQDANSHARFSGTKIFMIKDYEVWKITFI